MWARAGRRAPRKSNPTNFGRLQWPGAHGRREIKRSPCFLPVHLGRSMTSPTGTLFPAARKASGNFLTHACGLLQDAHSPGRQLRISWSDVDHEVAVDISQPGHSRAGKHVQHHLLGAGFHASRSRNHLWPYFSHDCEERCPLQGRVAIAGHGDRVGAFAPCIVDGGDG